ncbi:MAG: hypothetical protein SF123_12920 [Chloroflexota bacterium]|nr:hypothetical protein [Chloroflexota bacterium]
MVRFLISFFVAMLIGVGIGLYLGWVQFPAQFTNSDARALAQQYKDEYAVMIAAGYADDNDINGAVERLRVLEVENVPAFVQEVTERYITNSRGVDEIQLLVALAEGMGRLTPIMEPYRQVRPAEGA